MVHSPKIDSPRHRLYFLDWLVAPRESVFGKASFGQAILAVSAVGLADFSPGRGPRRHSGGFP